MKENLKKIVRLGSLILFLLLGVLGIAYAVFTYNKASGNSQLVVGDIYMHYKENNQLTLEQAMPSATYNENHYFEFTIDGKNTYEKNDIWYEIVLSHGENHETRTTRLLDKFLKFRLVEIKGGVETERFTNRSYGDLTNKRIWVNTIPKNTTNEIRITYRLYMWISDQVKIGNTSDASYTAEEWNDIFASIKVGVNGDFNEKDLSTDVSCFETVMLDNDGQTGIEITNYDATCGSDVIIPEIINGYPVVEIVSCQAMVPSSYASQETILNNLVFKSNQNLHSNQMVTKYDCAFKQKGITSIVIPSSVKTIGDFAFSKNQLTNISIPDSVITISEYAFSENRLTNVVIAEGVKTIGARAFSDNQLTNVSIPDSVITISEYAFYNNQLTNVVIAEGVKTIGAHAFSDNQLTNVSIPDSVITISEYAFSYNQLTSVEIGKGITYIENGGFDKNTFSNPNLFSHYND